MQVFEYWWVIAATVVGYFVHRNRELSAKIDRRDAALSKQSDEIKEKVASHTVEIETMKVAYLNLSECVKEIKESLKDIRDLMIASAKREEK